MNQGDRERWAGWRAARMRDALNQLFAAITCPAWLEGGIPFDIDAEKRLGPTMPGWFTRWTRLKEGNELWQTGYTPGEKLIGQAKLAGTTPWLRIPVSSGRKRAELEDYLGLLELEAGEGWSGRYLDLSGYSLSDAQELLAG
ncbi:MAG: hypothetical protein QM758_04740 [Armatimonas sp.]